MERATLTVEKSNKGKIFGVLTFENNKTMHVPKNFNLEESFNGSECDVYKNDNGQIVKIIVNGKELKAAAAAAAPGNRGGSTAHKGIQSKGRVGQMNANKPGGGYGKQKNKGGQQAAAGNISAKAPYNFIPLNQTLVLSEHAAEGKPPAFD